MSSSSEVGWKIHGESISSPIENKTRKVVEVEEPGKLLFLLFYVKGKFGGYLYSEGAKTRMENIKHSRGYSENIHEVHCIGVEDISDILEIIPRCIEKFGGKSKVRTKEVSYHSHAGGDGPIGSVNPKEYSFHTKSEFGQMKLEGWEQIDFNWSANSPRFVIYGCDSALEELPVDHPPQQTEYNNFARHLSEKENFKDVEVWGQSTKSYPSFVPDYRITSVARDFKTDNGLGWEERTGKTYQIAAEMHTILGIWNATHIGFDREDAEHQSDYDPAKPMRCYKNGKKIREGHQGYFNDHRKTLDINA